MITIIDYGMGNLGSIANMLRKIGADSVIASDPAIIERAQKLILPGVGAFDSGMANLNERNLVDILNKKVLLDKIPILGLCLGMQLLTQKSQEGKSQGLGWIEAETVKFGFNPKETGLKIPHMGWNNIQVYREHPLFARLDKDSRFYHVHSYHVLCSESDVIATTFYGYSFVSAIARGNILGVQFHPEKSHKFGISLLKNFVELN
jgi:glutamine amidotransferase